VSRSIRGAFDDVLPRERFGDQRDILGGAAQNVVGLAVGALAAAAAQILMSRTLGEARYGIVTLAVQMAFVGSTATRFGMDVANIRLVAILIGKGEGGRVRGLARRASLIALTVSVAVALLMFAAAGLLADAFTDRPAEAEPAFMAAALALPFAAMTQIYLGATRGLKIMRHTLYVQWIGQPLLWIGFTLAFWLAAETSGATVLAYAASWVIALVVAFFAWERESRPLTGVTDAGEIPEERVGALIRFGAFRAPAALCSHLVFWADLYVFSTLAGDAITGVYAATLLAAQTLFLFLTSLSLMFSPFVADLHHRGEHDTLDSLYKSVTRWTLAATLPILLVLLVMPDLVMRVFGPGFVTGADALLILSIGMIVPVSVGTVGFILIMVGRTGWDLLVYGGAIALDVSLALWLAQPDVLGIEGAATAQACTLAASAIVRLLLVRRFVRIWPFDRHFVRLLPAAVVGAAVMTLSNAVLPESEWFVNLVASAGLGTVTYGAALLGFGLKPGERATVGKLVRRMLGRDTAAPDG
jgi:O-antigen/teichoic acid export membrane protein